MTLSSIVLGLGVLSMLASISGSIAALGLYLRREDASLFGFGFASFYYGEMRHSHPRVFFASLGGAGLSIGLVVMAGVLG